MLSPAVDDISMGFVQNEMDNSVPLQDTIKAIWKSMERGVRIKSSVRQHDHQIPNRHIRLALRALAEYILSTETCQSELA